MRDRAICPAEYATVNCRQLVVSRTTGGPDFPVICAPPLSAGRRNVRPPTPRTEPR